MDANKADHTFVVLRVVLDQAGQLRYGELVDNRGHSWGRFINSDDLFGCLQAFLTSLIPAEKPFPADSTGLFIATPSSTLEGGTH